MSASSPAPRNGLRGRRGDAADRSLRAARGSRHRRMSSARARARGSPRPRAASSTTATRPTRAGTSRSPRSSPHQPESAPDRGRPDPLRPVGARLARGPGRLAVRAGRAELRPVHQLCDSFLEAEDRGVMSLIVGLGSPHGDDQLGWVAIDRLRPRLPAGIVRATRSAAGSSCSSALEGQDAAVVIDAAAPAGRPGTIRSFAWPSPELARCASAEHARPGAGRGVATGRDTRPASPPREHLHDRGAGISRPAPRWATTLRGNSIPWWSASSSALP